MWPTNISPYAEMDFFEEMKHQELISNRNQMLGALRDFDEATGEGPADTENPIRKAICAELKTRSEQLNEYRHNWKEKQKNKKKG